MFRVTQSGKLKSEDMNIALDELLKKSNNIENGSLTDRYNLKEMPSNSYPARAEQNVIDSHGTVIFSHGDLTGGYAFTQKVAKKHRRPCLHIDLDKTTAYDASIKINGWMYEYNIGILNIAGSKSSKDPKIYRVVKTIIKTAIRLNLAGIHNVAGFEEEIKSPPQTVDEAVDRLINELSLKDKTMIAKMPEYDLPDLHLNLGMYMRNNFKLWSGNIQLLKSCELVAGRDNIIKEGAASVIIRELWKKLKESHGLRVVK